MEDLNTNLEICFLKLISKKFIEHVLCVRPFLGAGDKAVNKTDKTSCVCRAYVLFQEDRQ